MNRTRALTVLTVLNLGTPGFTLLQPVRSVHASGPATVLRGSGLEIVDAQGKVRASIQIVPEGPARKADGSVAKDGKIYPETVLLRLIRPDGRSSVKVSTSEQGSGLTLGGGIDPTYNVLNADGGDASLGIGRALRAFWKDLNQYHARNKSPHMCPKSHAADIAPRIHR